MRLPEPEDGEEYPNCINTGEVHALISLALLSGMWYAALPRHPDDRHTRRESSGEGFVCSEEIRAVSAL